MGYIFFVSLLFLQQHVLFCNYLQHQHYHPQQQHLKEGTVVGTSSDVVTVGCVLMTASIAMELTTVGITVMKITVVRYLQVLCFYSKSGGGRCGECW